MKIRELHPIYDTQYPCIECRSDAKLFYEIGLGPDLTRFGLCLPCLTVLEGKMSSLLERMLKELRYIN